jgi:RHS repeat-associated protein
MVTEYWLRASIWERRQAFPTNSIFGYIGQQFDAETGLNYFKARYYDWKKGRLLAAGPSGFAAGNTNNYRDWTILGPRTFFVSSCEPHLFPAIGFTPSRQAVNQSQPDSIESSYR